MTRNILCLAVKDRAGRVVAVLQAINKIGGASFDAEDEQVCASCLQKIDEPRDLTSHSLVVYR